MALARYESVAVNTAGDVIPNATVEVRRDQPGRPVVPLWADREGTVPLGNPITTDSEGKFGFHVVGGSYYIRVFTGPSQQPFQQYVRRYQAIGTAGERDVEDLASALESGTATYPTLADLEVFVPATEGIGGKVTTGADAGFYHYDFGTSAWVFDRPLFDTLARMNVTGGDANDIEAEIVSGVADSAVVMLWIEATATNTGPVTINTKPVKTIDGNDLLAGQWLAGRTYWFSDEGTFYKLRTESDVSGLVAQAEAAATNAQNAQGASETAQTGAEAARDEAAGYAAGLNIPAIVGGDAGKLLTVKVDESGSEWVPPPESLPAGGVARQALVKSSGADFDVEWGDLTDVITAKQFGAVLDGSPGDLALVKTAWQAAVSQGKPFLVPLLPAPLVIQVPEDFSTVQSAHNAMLNWIFPGPTPKYADDVSGVKNHEAQIAVEISVAGNEFVSSGKGIVWNHPAGNVIRVKGRGAVGLTFDSLQANAYSSGVHTARLRFSTWPSADPVVGRAMRILGPTGTGDYRALDGVWRISAVDAVNKDITLSFYSRKKTSALTMTLTGGIFVYIPTQFRFINLPVSGADVAGFDVFTVLRLEDVTVSGSASGTNADDVDGVITRDGAAVYLGQHTGILEWTRCGLWVLNGGKASIDYSGICGNGIGINCIQGAHVDGGYVGVQGNVTYNVVANTAAQVGLTNGAFGGCSGAGIAVLASASGVFSGHCNDNTVGVIAGDGGQASVNAMTIQNNTEVDVKRTGPGAYVIGTDLSNVGTFNPPLEVADVSGGITTDNSGVVMGALMGQTTWNPAAIASGAQGSQNVSVAGAAVAMRAEAWANVSMQGLRLWADVTAAGVVTCYLSNNTGGSVDLGLFSLYVKVLPGEGA